MPSFVSVLQCTAPMSHATSQPTPHQASQLPHLTPQLPIQQQQETIDSTEALSQPELPPNPVPFSANTLRSSSPKPDATDLYLKSKAILDSKRKCARGFSPESSEVVVTEFHLMCVYLKCIDACHKSPVPSEALTIS